MSAYPFKDKLTVLENFRSANCRGTFRGETRFVTIPVVLSVCDAG